MLTDSDKFQIQNHGLKLDDVRQQIETFKTGVRFLKLQRPCTVGDGIARIDESAHSILLDKFKHARNNGRITKFIPASGAATRMFKDLLGVLNGTNITDAKYLSERIFTELPRFAVYDSLQVELKKHKLDFESLANRGELHTILSYLLTDAGLKLATLPKLLIPFHQYKNEIRTPFVEHLVESEFYIRDKTGRARLHFTISPQHEAAFKQHQEEVLAAHRSGTNFIIDYSFQKPSTDTVAVDLAFEPFRTKNNALLFRPAGHGALIENINDLKADILFIKNVDNVLPDPAKKQEILYKKILGGYLLSKEEQIFNILRHLEDDGANLTAIRKGLDFIDKHLKLQIPAKILKGSLRDQAFFIQRILNRPIRVCGMVKNTGEPGGGPFWGENHNGTSLRQIVEQVQIDTGDTDQAAILRNSTHFNPVDLVCSVRDFKGRPFDLRAFIDKDAGFISTKSLDGRDLLALELPGLWNGAMAYWTTFFVEMPASTFNPVKSFFDLLRPEHCVKLPKVQTI